MVIFPFDAKGQCRDCHRPRAHCDGPYSALCVEYLDRAWASMDAVDGLRRLFQRQPRELITEDTTQCPACHELLDCPENDHGDGESLGHTIDCPLDIGGP